VRTRVGLAVDGRSSLHPWTSIYPAGGTFIVMHVNWMSVLDSCQISLDCRLQHVIEINAKATAFALRPTAVSEGRPANRCVVQWKQAQRRRRRLTG